jgi:hypothetical protein
MIEPSGHFARPIVSLMQMPYHRSPQIIEILCCLYCASGINRKAESCNIRHDEPFYFSDSVLMQAPSSRLRACSSHGVSVFD